MRNVIERLVILERDEVILPKHLPLELNAGAKRNGKWLMELPADGVVLDQVERELVVQALDRTVGNQSRAAQLLGIERDALRRRMQRFRLLS
jgi:two-component system NtrC family response regulator